MRVLKEQLSSVKVKIAYGGKYIRVKIWVTLPNGTWTVTVNVC